MNLIFGMCLVNLLELLKVLKIGQNSMITIYMGHQKAKNEFHSSQINCTQNNIELVGNILKILSFRIGGD
jgi:hypothetical protein